VGYIPTLKDKKMTELVKLKKGDKVITRTKFDYEKNFIHWKMRGFELVEDKPAPKKTKKKKED
tara:strand:+ start:59 stop:247 length:189 start_codon:yes stop_codon:yes gene_type:complete